MINKKSMRSLLVVLVSFFMVVGCTPYSQSGFRTNSLNVKNQDDAGSVHTSVVNVVLWEEVSSELEAKFPMDETIALNESIPTTLQEQQQLIDAMKLTLKLALPTSFSNDSDEKTSASASSTNTSNTDGKLSSTSSSSKEESSTKSQSSGKNSGDIATVPDPDVFSGGEAATLINPLTGTIGRDPLLVRKNAISLLQSVRLLNRSIKDAVTRTGYTPYIVTLQHTLMPYARNQPLDAFSTTAFFSPDGFAASSVGTTVEGSIKSKKDVVADSVDGTTNPIALKNKKNGYMSISSENAKVEKDSIEITANPIVIPLLATDNLEAASQNRSSNFIRQFGLGVSAVIQGVAGNFSMDRFKQNVESIAGEDFNSLVTVGSVSENAIRVRFGAMNQGSTRYAMIPRNYNVHVLLLVKDEFANSDDVRARQVQILSRTAFKNVESGKELAYRSQREQKKMVKKVFQSLELDKPEMDQLKSKESQLLNAMLTNNYPRFLGIAKGLNLQEKAPSFWLELTELRIGSIYTSGVFEVMKPRKPDPARLFLQSVLLYDNGVESTARIYGSHLRGKKFRSHFGVDGLTIVNSKAEVAGNGSHILFSYPSLQPLGVKKAGEAQFSHFEVHGSGGKTLGVSCKDPVPNQSSENCSFDKIKMVVKKPPSPVRVDVRVPTTHILADSKSKGQVGIIISGEAQVQGRHFISVSGADASSDSGTQDVVVRNAEGLLEIKKDGLGLLNLRNLSPGQSVEFIVTGEDGQTQSTHTRFVVQLPVSES